MFSLSIFSLSIFILNSLTWAGGAQGNQLGKLYTQLTYSTIQTGAWVDPQGDVIDTSFYSRNQVENYGELGIWGETTTLAWNLKWQKHQLAGQSSQGLGSSYLALQHQVYAGAQLQLGYGISAELASPQKPQLPLSQEEHIYGFSQFLSYQQYQLNLHYLNDLQEQGIQFQFRRTWQPSSALYLSAVVQGQFTSTDYTQDPSMLGYGLNAQYIAPGVEAFYSVAPQFHIVGAFYSGELMRNIYGFPGLKLGFAWTP